MHLKERKAKLTGYYGITGKTMVIYDQETQWVENSDPLAKPFVDELTAAAEAKALLEAGAAAAAAGAGTPAAGGAGTPAAGGAGTPAAGGAGTPAAGGAGTPAAGGAGTPAAGGAGTPAAGGAGTPAAGGAGTPAAPAKPKVDVKLPRFFEVKKAKKVACCVVRSTQA